MIEEATTFDVSTRHSAMSYLIVYLCEMYLAFDNVMLDCIYFLRHVEINFRLIFLSTNIGKFLNYQIQNCHWNENQMLTYVPISSSDLEQFKKSSIFVYRWRTSCSPPLAWRRTSTSRNSYFPRSRLIYLAITKSRIRLRLATISEYSTVS